MPEYITKVWRPSIRAHRSESRKVDYPIYTMEEARELGMKFKYWRDITVEKGDYVLTDDNYVIEVLNVRRDENNPKNAIIGTPFARGTYPDLKWRVKLTKAEPIRNALMNGGRYSKKEHGLTAMQQLFCDMVNIHFDLKLAASQVFNVYGRTATRKANYLMHKQCVREQIMENCRSKLEEYGLTEEFLIQDLVQAITDGSIQEKIAGRQAAYRMMGMDKKISNNDTPVSKGQPVSETVNWESVSENAESN